MTVPDPTPLNLDAIRADVEYAGSGIDGADLPYHPHALAAMRAAETLLAEVERLRGARLLSVVFGHHEGAPRPFALYRREDATGVSGTGVVALGSEFPDGMVVLRWTSDWPTSVVFHERGIESVEAIHGHGGKTQVVWLSDELEPLAEAEAERDRLRDDLAACRAERDTRAAGYLRTVNDLTATHRVELGEALDAVDELRAELARTTARRDEIWAQFLALEGELAARDKAPCGSSRADVAEDIAVDIERELVCCDIYERDGADPDPGAHAACYWGGAAAKLAREHATLDPGGFHEDDEPAVAVQAAFDTGVKRLTAPPTLDGPSTRALGHFYLSTGCWHGLCNTVRADGTPACRQTCKWCQEPCQCTCHPLPDGGAA